MILCYSGGLDSMIAWHYLEKPKSIYFNCSRYSIMEMESVSTTNPKCIISHDLDFRKYEQGENSYIPHRNLMFAAVASNYSNKVVIAGVKDDVVEDKNPNAFFLMSKVLSETSKGYTNIISPFWDWTKSEVVRWFLNNVKEAEWYLQHSVSCYSGEKYCGSCPSCFRKACALFANGIVLPWNNSKLASIYYDKALNAKYDPDRNLSILQYVRNSRSNMYNRG